MMTRKLSRILFFFLISFAFLSLPAAFSQDEQKTLYVFDLEAYLEQKPENKVWQYDVINLVSALQGLVNRDEPRLYIFFVRERLSGYLDNVDEFWLNYLRSVKQEFVDHHIVRIETLEDLIAQFRSDFTAVVLWDPEVPATGNVALTISGVDGFLPIRYDKSPDSVYTQLIDQGPELPPRQRLKDMFSGVGKIPDTNIETTRTKKGDAYLWARSVYLDNGMCSPTYYAYFLDPYDWDERAPGFQYPDLQACQIVNHDFYVSKKSFFMDVDPWWDEIPTDIEGNQFVRGVDRVLVFDDIFNAAQSQVVGMRDPILRVGGFVPWWIKYTEEFDGQHTMEETAEEFIAGISSFNGVIDGDRSPFGALANASIFQHVPLKDQYQQNPVPQQRNLEKKNYLLFVIGSFDSSAFMYQTIPLLWRDPARGEIPLSWAISPLTSDRVPHIINYMYDHRTENDYFISATPGLGMCYPNRFISPRESDLDNGLPYLERVSKEAYNQLDLHMTVSADLDRKETEPVIFDQSMQRFFKSFSPHGVSTLKPFQYELSERLVPFIQETEFVKSRMPDEENVAQTIYEHSKKDEPAFHLYRFKLANPTALYYLYQKIQRQHPEFNYELVDPYTFFYLMRHQYAEDDPTVNYYLPTFLSTTIPLEMETESRHQTTVTLRNDGWDIWNPPEVRRDQRYRIIYHWMMEGEEYDTPGVNAGYVEETVMPGAETEVNLLIRAPDQPGLYKLLLNFEQENVEESPIVYETQVTVQ